jgi:hypothetical protein
MKALLAQAVKAAGGEKNLAKFRAVTMKFKGKSYFMGEVPFTAEWTVQYPDRSRATVTAEFNNMKFTVVTVIDKDKGWMKLNDDTMPLDKERLASEKEQMYARWVSSLVPLGDKGFTLAPAGEAKVDGRDAVGIKVSHKGHRDVSLYFDKKTHLLLKSEAVVKDMGGQDVKQESFFRDYKEVAGTKRPMKVTIKRGGEKFVDVEETTEIKPERKLDDRLFAEP